MESDYYKYISPLIVNRETIFYKNNSYNATVIEAENDSFWEIGKKYSITSFDKMERVSNVNEIKRLDKKRFLLSIL